jgi:hypothetical protein
MNVDENEQIAPNENKLILVNYDSASNIWGSDHRPVYA